MCESTDFQAECAQDEVIVMTTATYGRMYVGNCVKKNMGHLGCQANVLSVAQRSCSGLRACTIRIPSQDFDVLNQCDEDLRIFFEAGYSCVKGRPL